MSTRTSRSGVLVLSENKDMLLIPLSTPISTLSAPSISARRPSLHTPSPSIDLDTSRRNDTGRAGTDTTDLIRNLGATVISLRRATGLRDPEHGEKGQGTGDESIVFGLREETKWAQARRAVRDKYCNTKWSQFHQLVGIIPPGGSLGLDNKVFSFPLTSRGPSSSPKSRSSTDPKLSVGAPGTPHTRGEFSPEYGILRFENGATMYEFTDLRVNPRCLVESHLFEIRNWLESLVQSGMGVDSMVLVFDGVPESSIILSIARSILPIPVSMHTHSTPPTPPLSPAGKAEPASPSSPQSFATPGTDDQDGTIRLSMVHSPLIHSPASPSPPVRPSSTGSILSVLSTSRPTSSGTHTQATSTLPTPPVSAVGSGMVSGSKLANALRLTAAREDGHSKLGENEAHQKMDDGGGQEGKRECIVPNGVAEPLDDGDSAEAGINVTVDPHLLGLLASIPTSTGPLYLPLDAGPVSWEKETYEAIYTEWKRLRRIVDARAYLAPFPQPPSLLYRPQITRPSPLGMEMTTADSY